MSSFAKKHGLLILIGLLVLTFGVGMFARVIGAWGSDSRPRGVPPDAKLVSLIVSGTWFEYSFDPVRNANKVRAWDLRGQLLADGYFRLEDENRPATNSELHPSLVQFRYDVGSTDYIYLFKRYGFWGGKEPFGKILVPIDDYSRRRLR